MDLTRTQRRIGAVFAVFFLAAATASAAEITAALTPELRYAAVDGHVDKFEAHHWLGADLDGGAREFTLKSDDGGNGFALMNEARFFPGNADYFYELSLKNEDVAYVDFSFNQFRKYYSSTGGVHPQGSHLAVISGGRDLYVDIGKFELAFGLTPPDLPDLEFLYEHEYKKGTKSRLTWATVTVNGSGLKTGPSWQELDEEVDVFEVKLSDDWNGTHWVSEQKWEHFTNFSTRREQNYSTATTASQRMMRDHILEPESDLFSSIFELKRWLWKNKALARAGYRYAQIENSEMETILEKSESGVPTTFSANSHQVARSPSTNQYGSHTGVLSLSFAPVKEWVLGLKGKAEEIKKNGQSTLMNDNAGAAPNGVIDRFDVSNTDSRLLRFGEGINLRYTGIPNLSIYNELEFEQNDNDLVEDRTSGSAGEVFSRETFNRSYRGVEEVGFHYHPNSFLLWAAQYRYLKDNIDYDDQRETLPTATGAKSAFMDGLHNETHEVATRTTLNFCDWFSPTFKYQYRDHGYTARFESADLDLRSDVIAHIYTADLPIKTIPELFMTASWQFQDTYTLTPANEDTPQNFAPFHGDVNTWMLAADYLLNKDVTLRSSFQYQYANNSLDVASRGLPFGADYDKVDLEIGLGWRLAKNITLEPSYNYYSYRPNERIEPGEYEAHVGWLGVSIEWA